MGVYILPFPIRFNGTNLKESHATKLRKSSPKKKLRKSSGGELFQKRNK